MTTLAGATFSQQIQTQINLFDIEYEQCNTNLKLLFDDDNS